MKAGINLKQKKKKKISLLHPIIEILSFDIHMYVLCSVSRETCIVTV